MSKYYFSLVFRTSFVISIFPALIIGRSSTTVLLDSIFKILFCFCLITPTIGFLLATLFIHQTYKQLKILLFNCGFRYSTQVFRSFAILALFYAASFILICVVRKIV